MDFTNQLPLISLSQYSEVANMVRQGTQPDEPRTIDAYLFATDVLASDCGSVTRQRAVYIRAIRILMDTICDASVAEHWRRQCLDQIYKPLYALKRLASDDTDVVQCVAITREINVLGQYFL